MSDTPYEREIKKSQADFWKTLAEIAKEVLELIKQEKAKRR